MSEDPYHDMLKNAIAALQESITFLKEQSTTIDLLQLEIEEANQLVNQLRDKLAQFTKVN